MSMFPPHEGMLQTAASIVNLRIQSDRLALSTALAQPGWVAPPAEPSRESTEQELARARQALQEEIERNLRTSRALRESEIRFQLIADQTGLVVYDCDSGSDSCRWGGALLRVTGHSPAELEVMGASVWDRHIHPDDCERVRNARTAASAASCKLVLHYRFQHAAGHFLEVEDEGVCLPNREGAPARMFGSLRDISERVEAARAEQRRHERALARQKALLELAQSPPSPLPDTLSQILKTGAQALDIDQSAFWRLDGAGRLVPLQSWHRLRGCDPGGAWQLNEQEHPAYFAALRTSHLRAVNDIRCDAASASLNAEILGPPGIGALIDVPVWLHGRLQGVLSLAHAGGARSWSPEEIEFAAALGHIVSLALASEERRCADERLAERSTALERANAQLSQEIAERLRTESDLRESEEKYRLLFECEGDAVALLDAETLQILDANPAFAALHGVPRHACITTPLDPFVADPVALRAALRPPGSQAIWTTTSHQRSSDGRLIPVEITAVQFPFRGRSMICAMLRDASVRLRTERELQNALERERELGQLKSDFIGMVSHEYRTPLGIIMSSAEILRDYFDRLEPDERVRHLSDIHDAAQRMADLIEEVLLLSRAEAGRLEFAPVEIDLVALLRRVIDEIGVATNHTHSIDFQSEPLPGPGRGDDALLRHIFHNLLSNAVKYSPAGSTVRVHLAAEGANAKLTVHDDGIGIPPEDRDRLFRAFHRGRNVGTRSGTGLGLVIVKRCVDLLEGTLSLDSQVGQGTRATVWLPLFR